MPSSARSNATSLTPTSLKTVAGPVLALVVGLLAAWSGLPRAASLTAAVTALCAVWWVTEAIPIPATSIIPFAAFPLLGILPGKQVATAYGHDLILLLMGGFILSTAMERSGAHRRVALGMVRAVGRGSRKRLVLGFMLATAVCSMWISNTATVLMLLPVVLAVIQEDESNGQGTLAVPLLLGVAWSASIGGMGTPVGTPPNVILMGVYEEVTGQSISFLEWMGIGLPAVLILLPVAWLWVTRKMTPGPLPELPALGPWRSPERRVLAVFAITASAWVLRKAPAGGWAELLSVPDATDATVGLTAVVAMFLIPNGEGERLLDWPTATRIPWGLLLLFGGGIAIARAFDASGLSAALGDALSGVTALPVLAMIGIVCLSVTFLTEVTSNTATTTLLMPVLAAAALAAGVEPKQLMVPAALSASCAFMLPVATAPNAVVFGTGRLKVAQMAEAGLALNLVGAVVLTGICALLLG